MKYVTAYLNFDGNCRQAMNFYNERLGSEMQINPYPDAKGSTADPKARIMHSQLVRNGEPFLMASDIPPGSELRPGNNLSVSVDCDSLEEIERVFAAMGQNGQVRVPLADMPWGARFGMLTDRFGVQWLFNWNVPRS